MNEPENQLLPPGIAVSSDTLPAGTPASLGTSTGPLLPAPAAAGDGLSTPLRKPRRRPGKPSVSAMAHPPSPTPAPTAPGTDDREEALLARLGQSAQYCRQIEEQLAKYAGPELDAIMRLHRLVILKLSVQAEVKPELWDVLKDLMKPVMDWARLQEQQKDREFAERKYREQLEAEKAEAHSPKNPAEAALTPETLEKIEFELKLL